MRDSREAPRRLHLIGSFLLYLAATPLLSRFVSASGSFGILYAIPLAAAAWHGSRHAGVAVALLGVLLNEAVWVWLHGAGEVLVLSRVPEMVSAILLEAAAFVIFALAVARIRNLRERYERSEELRRLSESNYLGLIELAPEGAAVVQDMRIVHCNDHLLAMFGYGRAEVLGKPFHLMLHEEERERAVQLYVRRLDGEPGNAGEVRYLRKDTQTRWMNYVGKRIQWDGRPAALYLVSDITGKKALEQQWRQSQKLEAIGRLAGGIAHDFNNTLQVILGSCESLAEHAGDRIAVLADAGVVKDAASSAATLTRQLLAFSRTQGGQPKVVDVGTVLQRSEKMLECVLGEDISLTVILGEEPALVRADEGRLQQVLMNLAVNARDAMPNGGSFTIRVAREQVRGGFRALPGLPDGAYVTLNVSDTGCGMNEDTLEHLFEPFFTTKETSKGTGLGLWIVHGIVTQSGGRISVKSQAGRGATFTVHLPQAVRETDRCGPEEAPMPQRGSGTILLVEDQDAVRKLVKVMLERHGYTVTAVRDGQTALEVCRSLRGVIDLLLTDLVMPGMRGEVLADLVRTHHPETRVVLMTGHHERFADCAEGDGRNAMLLKPFRSDQLLAVVLRALELRPAETRCG